MKIEIVKFDNDLYGVRCKQIFDTRWLDDKHLYFRHSFFPSKDCTFLTFKEAEDAIRAYKIHVKAKADIGRVVERVKS